MQTNPGKKFMNYDPAQFSHIAPQTTLLDNDAIDKTADRQQRSLIHIRIQQRSGRKTLTTVQGLPKAVDPKKVLKAFKKDFACNGTIVDDEELGEVIQLQGDHRAKVSELLIDEGICKKEEIQVHGF